MKNLPLICLVLVSCCQQALVAATVDFDAPGGLWNNFNRITGTGANRYTEASSGGVGNSGSIGFTRVSLDETTAIYNQSSFDFSIPNTQLSISMFFHVVPIQRGPGGPQGQLLQIGFAAENNTSLAELAPPFGQLMSVGLVPIGTTGDSFQMFIRNAQGGSISVGLPTRLDLTPGHFYELTGIFENTGPSSYSSSGVLDDYGTDGLTWSGTVFQGSISGWSSPIASDTAVWGGFVSQSANGTDHLDMFAIQVVPEPSAWALVGLGAATLAACRRRKRSSPPQREARTKKAEGRMEGPVLE